MNWKTGVIVFLVAHLACPLSPPRDVSGCAPFVNLADYVANADQTVIMIWDADKKVQHFIRQANFKTDAQDFGFIVPSPNQPELASANNQAFQFCLQLTAPKIIHSTSTQTARTRSSFGCADAISPSKAKSAEPTVRVLETKQVAGYDATVLEADSTAVLAEWMKTHDFNFSPAMEVWAKPYVEQKWKFTALKLSQPTTTNADSSPAQKNPNVTAEALRISFATETPLFPYREPEYGEELQKLQAHQRLLRFYFVAEARYAGTLTPEKSWTGRAVWSKPILESQRKHILELLKLPEDTGPKEFWLTEFEDNWPYSVAPADLTFSLDADQTQFERPPVYVYQELPYSGDVTLFALLGVVTLPIWLRRQRKLAG
jgi:hypothetical protein